MLPLVSTGHIAAHLLCHAPFQQRFAHWICRFRTLDVSKLEERRRLIDSFVNSVTVFDDYILITFNYKEGEERLDFTDIESSDLQSVGGPCGVSL